MPGSSPTPDDLGYFFSQQPGVFRKQPIERDNLTIKPIRNTAVQKVLLPFVSVLVLSGCTFGSVSSIPMEIPGVGTVYRYQGRANFSHQIAEADRMMVEDCKARNGGKPVVVDLQKSDVGMMVVNSGQATTNYNARATGNYIYGTANTSLLGTSSGLRNQNQEILYKCVTD